MFTGSVTRYLKTEPVEFNDDEDIIQWITGCIEDVEQIVNSDTFRQIPAREIEIQHVVAWIPMCKESKYKYELFAGQKNNVTLIESILASERKRFNNTISLEIRSKEKMAIDTLYFQNYCVEWTIDFLAVDLLEDKVKVIIVFTVK